MSASAMNPSSGPWTGQPPASLSAYELERLAQIQANEALFRSLGLAADPAPTMPRVKRIKASSPSEKSWSSPRKRQRSEEGGGAGQDSGAALAGGEGAGLGLAPGRAGSAVVLAAENDADTAASDDELLLTDSALTDDIIDVDAYAHEPIDVDALDFAYSYEAERLARIKENDALLLSLGLFVPPPPKIVQPRIKPVIGPKSWTSPREVGRRAKALKAALEQRRRQAKLREAAQREEKLRAARQREREKAARRRAERPKWAAPKLVRAVDQAGKGSKMAQVQDKKAQYAQKPVREGKVSTGKLSPPSYARGQYKKPSKPTPVKLEPLTPPRKTTYTHSAPISPAPSLARSNSSRSSTSSTILRTPPPAMPTLRSLLSRTPAAAVDPSVRRSSRGKADISYSIYYRGGTKTAEFYALMRERTILQASSKSPRQLWPSQEVKLEVKSERSDSPAPQVSVEKDADARFWVEIPYRRFRRQHVHAVKMDDLAISPSVPAHATSLAACSHAIGARFS